MATAPITAPISSRYRYLCLFGGFSRHSQGALGDLRYPLNSPAKRLRRRTLICAVNEDAEKSFKKILEVDRLIDVLRVSNPGELQQLVVENVLAFNESFWIRLAARTETCKSDDDKKDYEELAASVMSIVDRLVHKTNEKIESSTDVLKAILRPIVDETHEVSWPPQGPEALKLMEEEIQKREQEGQLDEGFLAEVNAQLRQFPWIKRTRAIVLVAFFGFWTSHTLTGQRRWR